jgi:hypothetical protein
MQRMVEHCGEHCFSKATAFLKLFWFSCGWFVRIREDVMRSVTVRACLGFVVAAALTGGMLAAGPADATTAAAPHWRVTVISPPVNPASVLTGVACPTSTWCAAVGWDGHQAPEDGTQAYFALAESRGRWSPATTGVLPPGVMPAAANVNGIACTGKGSCVAVGAYSGGPGSAFIAVEQHGIWQRAFRPACLEAPPGRPMACSMP